MEIILSKRYNGMIPIERKCDIIENSEFDFLFSFRFLETIDEENDEFLIGYFNPHIASCILNHFDNFTFYYKKENKNFLVKARVLENRNAKAVIKVEKDLITPEKRKYNRFKLSKFDLPEFSIYSNDKKISGDARILEISLRGLQILTSEVEFNDEDLLEIVDEKRNINIGLIKPVLVENVGNEIVIRGEIKKTNINMTKFMIETYIKVAKEIINTYCKKG